MTDFRSTDQIASDFRRLDPGFSQITRRNQLLGFLTDHQMDEASAAATGAGPVVFNLGVLDGPEWEGVRTFLNSRLVSQPARAEFRQLETDLRAADTNGDHYLNNQEIVTFTQSHSDRWSNVALFRTAANGYLNRLPAYVAQPNLTEQQVSRLWGMMNHYSQQWDAAGTDATNRGTLYGLSLDGFPSTDQNNPPNLIRRAMSGQLTPEELGAVHQILQIQKTPQGQFDFSGDAPLNPEEIGMLGTLLEGAARKGRPYQGMTILTGDQERQFISQRNEVVQRFRQELTAAHGNPAAVQAAFQRINREMSRLEADHPERISATTLTMRAYMGDLNPAEVASLRDWMRTEALTQSVTCNGALDCMRVGFMRFFQGIARDPWHFIAHNGAFIGGSMLYRRFVLRNAFERRVTQLCGGNGVANPRQAYRDYEKFIKQQASQNPLWRRLPRSILQNPYVGLAVFNFGIAPAVTGIWDGITGSRQHPALDFVTDGVGILAFEAFETYDAFFNQSGLQNFAQANPGLCRPQSQEATAPAPETVVAAESAAELAAKPLREFTQINFETYLQPQLLEQTFAHAPRELAPLLADDSGRDWRATYDQIETFQRNPSALADLLAGQYARDSVSDTRIRQDVTEMMTAFPTWDNRGLAPTFRWALQTYIRNLETNGLTNGQWIADVARSDGIARTYFSIQANMGNTHVSFEEGAAMHWEMVDTVANHGVRPIRLSTATALSSEFNFAFEEFGYVGGRSWDDHLALERVLPHAGDLLVARFASEDPVLAQRIRADMNLLSIPYSRYGSHEQPITSEATNSYKWALREYINALSSSRTPDISSLVPQINSQWSARQVYFREQEGQARQAANAEHQRRYNSDPAYRAQQDAEAQYEADENARLDPFNGMPGHGGPMFLPLVNGVPALPSFSMGPIFSPSPLFAF